MRGAVLHAPGDVRFEERADPKIVNATDADIRTVATCVCGSDLWALETTAADLQAPFAFSVVGSVTAVRNVLPGMRELGRGTVLFVNGGSAVQPHTERAGTSIAFAAESAYARMLHDQVAPDGIHVGQLIIPGAITAGDARKDPDVLAGLLWDMHRERTGFRHFAEPFES